MPWVLNVSVSCNSMLDQISTLEKEVKLDYKHTMNMISFDRVVASKPEMFSFVTLPDKVQKEAPEKGKGHSEAVCFLVFDRICCLL